jgi:hypothetical protein
MELQLTLMLDIADEVGGVGTTERLLARFMRHLRSLGTDQDVLEARRAIFGSENSSVAGGKSGHRACSSSRGGEGSETDDSGTEVKGGKGGGDGNVSMGQDKGKSPVFLFLPDALFFYLSSLTLPSFFFRFCRRGASTHGECEHVWEIVSPIRALHLLDHGLR